MVSHRSSSLETPQAVVKWGVGRQSAKCLHPSKGRAIIKKSVTAALGKIGDVKPFKVDEPVEFKLRFANSIGGDIASRLPYAERLDGRMIKAVFGDYPLALRGLSSAISLGIKSMSR